MKTTIKTLSYLFAIIAGGMLWASCECDDVKKENVKIKKDNDSLIKLTASRTVSTMAACTTTTFPLSDNTFSFDKANKRFVIKNCASGSCTVNVPDQSIPSLKWLKIEIVSGNMVFTNNVDDPGAGFDTKDVVTTNPLKPLDINIVKNNYKWPDITLGSNRYIIIGADEGRNISYSEAFPPATQITYADLEVGPIYIRRNTGATTYKVKQATTTGLDKKLFDTAQILAIRNDQETCE